MSQTTHTTESVPIHSGEPGESKPAPGSLALVQAFINTADLLDDLEDLVDADALSAWLARRDLIAPTAPVTTRDLQRALELREALRALLIANAGGQLDPDALKIVNRAVAAADLTPIFAGNAAASLQPNTGGVDGALGKILAIVFAAMADGSWSRLKACHYDSCRWAYYDASKNRSGTWCSMSTCGNRVKTRAYRQRRSQ